jgi:integrase
VFRARSIRTAFERAWREERVHGFRFHDLRHTTASWLVMAGRSLKEVQELLGHRTFAMTLRYAHLSPDRLRDAVNSLPVVGVPPRRTWRPTRNARLLRVADRQGGPRVERLREMLLLW